MAWLCRFICCKGHENVSKFKNGRYKMLLGSLGRHNIMYTFVKACLKINLLV